MLFSVLPFTLLLATLSTATASPSLPLVSDDLLHLVPRNTLFLRAPQNLQTFTGTLGNSTASAITNSGDTKRPFEVDGNTFTDFKSAAQRTCDNQFQECQLTANQNGGGNKGGLSVNDCDSQKNQCNQAQTQAKQTSFSSGTATTIIPDPEFDGFELICDA